MGQKSAKPYGFATPYIVLFLPVWQGLNMRVISHFLLILFLLFCMPAGMAHAADTILVRGGDHDGYSRLVFEGSAPPTYKIRRTDNGVFIDFSVKAEADLIGLTGDLRNAKNVKAMAGGQGNLTISAQIPAGSDVRDFTIGSKLVLDVYDSKTKAEAKASTAGSQNNPEEKMAATEKAEPKAPAQKTGDFSVHALEPAQALPAQKVEAHPVTAPALQEHNIELTTVTNVGLSAYRRHGYLWMVFDNPDLQASPVLHGPSKDKFGAIEKTDLKDADLYALKLPDGAQVMVEGGGLSWNIKISGVQPKSAELAILSPERVGDSKDSKLLWPLQTARKAIQFTDPLSGDDVTAVTSSSAVGAMRPVREYIDFTTPETFAGFVFIPSRDGVRAEVSGKGILMSRAGGMALSKPEDIKASDIRKEMAATKLPDAKDEKPKETEQKDLALKEEPPKPQDEIAHKIEEEISADNVKVDTAEISKATQEKPTGNNIYNFKRWEMGGMAALPENMHALMAEVAAKPSAEQTEDIITMAKLLLANNHAQEALGMLRIAEQQVPELAGTAEFDSLKAAAKSLSGKYDEAIVILSDEALKKYDDVRLWRGFTLAGLQDWKQAGENMTDAAAVKEYPHDLRVTMLLVMAEVALRNAKPAQAQTILDSIGNDIKKMTLPYRSSWAYLSGEAARQSGNNAKAKELWLPLVKNGKDDLFRAKAGLSLTRLQIDEKSIKTDEAIDRLEGLRYAWRGDELETLINYRLGQLYVENKEYLKGLTVLRNAAELTPELQIGQDVLSLMSKSFREVFSNDRLSAMSPIEAISFYEEFKDLTPPGDEGIEYVEKLSQRLVDADLLGRAAALLEYQVNNRLQGDKKVEIAIRLAAIRLLDGNPDGALRSLEIAQSTLDKIAGIAPKDAEKVTDKAAALSATGATLEKIETQAGDAEKSAPEKVETSPKKETADPEKQRQIYLLKARALSMKKKPDEALAVLENMRTDSDVNKLRTDIAWMAGKWEEAAMSLNDLIIAEDVSPRRPLTDYQQDLILNRAIALNLSGNRIALANLRERHNRQMVETPKGKMFEVVTRPRRPDMVGSREAIESMMSEIDLFKGFLDSYAKSQAVAQEGAKTIAPVKEPAVKTEEKAKTETKPTDAKADEPKPESSADGKEAAEKPAEKTP